MLPFESRWAAPSSRHASSGFSAASRVSGASSWRPWAPGAGTWLALVALEVDVWTRTESSAWVAALLIADLLPTFVIGILVGPLIDRLSRRRLMIGADLVRFGVFAALPFATSATQIVALAAVAGIATGFFRPAVYAGLPNLVDDADLPSANSLLQTVDNLTWALGSLVGGLLVAGSGVGRRLLDQRVHLPHLRGLPLAGSRPAAAGHCRREPRPLARPEGRLRPGRALAGAPDRAHRLERGDVLERRSQRGGAAARLPRLQRREFGLGLMMGCSGIGLAIGAFLASSWIERRGLPNVYGASLGLMAVGIGLAAMAPTSGSRPPVSSSPARATAPPSSATRSSSSAVRPMRCGTAFAVLMSSERRHARASGWSSRATSPTSSGARGSGPRPRSPRALAGVVGFALSRALSAARRGSEPHRSRNRGEPTQRAVCGAAQVRFSIPSVAARRDFTRESLAAGVRAGDRRALARAITLVENSDPLAYEVVRDLYPETGRAYAVGVTGPPGVGKSSLISALVRHVREQERSVGVISVDPSSPFTQGALLGDRIRLADHFLDPEVFIRSMGTRGHLGGLAEATLQALLLLDAAGKELRLPGDGRHGPGRGRGDRDRRHRGARARCPGRGTRSRR